MALLLEIKRNKQFSPGHRDIRTPEQTGAQEERNRETTPAFNPDLEVKGSGKTKTTLIPRGLKEENVNT